MAEVAVDEVITAVEAAIDGERYDRAIDVLNEANRARRSPLFERRLIEARRLAFDDLAVPEPAGSWPPATDDPFPGVSGLPEVTPDRLDAPTVGGGVAHHGAVMVRGLLTSEAVAELVGAMDRAFEVQDSGEIGEGQSWFVPTARMGRPRHFLSLSSTLFAADSPRVVFDLFERLRQWGIVGLVGEHFGEPATVAINKFTLRRVVPDAGPTTWHQDGAFLGEGVRALNLWISLTDSGGDIDDTPGLAVVPRRVDEILAAEGAGVPHAVSNSLVNERFGDEIVRPRVAAGDALFFDELFLHKTGRRRGMTKPRHAIECWFFPRSAFPPDYEGMVV